MFCEKNLVYFTVLCDIETAVSWKERKTIFDLKTSNKKYLPNFLPEQNITCIMLFQDCIILRNGNSIDFKFKNIDFLEVSFRDPFFIMYYWTRWCWLWPQSASRNLKFGESIIQLTLYVNAKARNFEKMFEGFLSLS